MEPCKIFWLEGSLGEFVGEMARHGTMIALTGDECGGRTTFTLLLAKQLAAKGMRVKCRSLREGLGWSFKTRLRTAGIGNTVKFTDWANLGAIRKAARLFDVIVFDTYTALGLGRDELANLKADFPKMVLVSVQLKGKGG